MKFFSNIERKGLLFFAPLMAIILMLAGLYRILDVRMLSEDDLQPLIEQASAPQQFKPFNPNSDEYEQLREAGVPQDVAVGIVRWRKYGKVYRMAEDLAMVSGMNDSLYAQLKPYITIDDSLKIENRVAEKRVEKPRVESSARRMVAKSNIVAAEKSKSKKNTFRVKPESFLVDTVSVEYLAGWGLSKRQAEVLVKYRDASGGIFSEEHLRRCYVVDGAVADSLAKYIIYTKRAENEDGQTIESRAEKSAESRVKNVRKFEPIEINEADSAALVAIDGIGPKSASEIIKYRNLLGGYYSVEQIAELKCITEANFSKFLTKILCDSCKISKIDINFAAPKELERHPYVSAQTLRRIVKQRQLKGGWSRVEEMTEQNILSEDEAKRLAPYLRFRPIAAE